MFWPGDHDDGQPDGAVMREFGEKEGSVRHVQDTCIVLATVIADGTSMGPRRCDWESSSGRFGVLCGS